MMIMIPYYTGRRYYDSYSCFISALILLLLLLVLSTTIHAEPQSRPYIAYRTNPFNQSVHHDLDWDSSASSSTKVVRPYLYDEIVKPKSLCTQQFTLGIAKTMTTSLGHSIRHHALSLASVFPSLSGGGKQIVYTSIYETLNVLTPEQIDISSMSTTRRTYAGTVGSGNSGSGGTTTSGGNSGTTNDIRVVKEVVVQMPDFPLLLESSLFHNTHPILHDVNADGIMDVILTDYHGSITILGLGMNENQERYRHYDQVPRLFVRREWVERMVQEVSGIDDDNKNENEQDIIIDNKNEEDNMDNNNTTALDEPHVVGQQVDPLYDPFHSYFEFTGGLTNTAAQEQKLLIRGETADIFDQSSDHANSLLQRRRRSRRSRQEQQRRLQQEHVVVDNAKKGAEEDMMAAAHQHRRLQDHHDLHFYADAVFGHQHGQDQKEEAEQQQQQQQPEEDMSDLHAGALFRDNEEEELQKRNPDGGEEERHLMFDDANMPLADDLEIPELLDETDHGVDDMMVIMPDSVEEEGGGSGDNNNAGGHIYDDDDEYRARGRYGDDVVVGGGGEGGGEGGEVGMMMDDYYYGRYRGDYYDDMYSYHNTQHSEYYDSKHYIRIPPHILTTPLLVEVPKMYGNTNDKEDILLVPVSYYLDEDEYEGFFPYKRFQDDTATGDESEVSRGLYVASAIMVYNLGDSPRFSGQTHLDLSTDYTCPENATLVRRIPLRSDTTNMGAFALSSPTAADLDGDGHPEVIVGTSMGLVYAFDARQMFKRDRWPVQFRHPIEQRILVEDVVGNTNLEVFVADIGGNIVCLNHQADIVWHRDFVSSLNLGAGQTVRASSPMALGDANGDGKLDVVQLIRVGERSFVFAVTASTGEDLEHFPIELDGAPKLDSDEIHQKLPQPLLVDLHGNYPSILQDYIRRNGTAWKQPKPAPVQGVPGGVGPGLHVVQPHGQDVFIIEAGSGCTQKMSIGDEVSSMVQVDDVHGTDKLDLVVATEGGRIVTFESDAPYHPLNTWSGGEVRGRGNLHAHGYSASQGIFVHSASRQFRDIFGIYVPITFEIFDNRPNIANEQDKQKYLVEVRDGPSWKRVLWRKEYNTTGVYSELVYIRYGPGYYTLSVSMLTSHGIIYEDMFSIGYNVRFLDGFGVMLWLPLVLMATAILLCGVKKANWDVEDDDDFDNGREGHSLGILGRSLPT